MSQYPTKAELKKIIKWEPTDFHGLMEFIKEIWEFGDWGFHQEGNIYNLSTGGWSGNEDIIQAMQNNMVWWAFFWEQSRRGGHYIFSKPDWFNLDKK